MWISKCFLYQIHLLHIFSNKDGVSVLFRGRWALVNMITQWSCQWSADWENTDVLLCDCVLMKCILWSRQSNDTSSRNCSLHKVFHVLSVFFFLFCKRNTHSITLDCPLSSFTVILSLKHQSFLFLVNLMSKSNPPPLPLVFSNLAFLLYNLCPYSFIDSSL